MEEHDVNGKSVTGQRTPLADDHTLVLLEQTNQLRVGQCLIWLPTGKLTQ
jgi:hypothetical protein